jgi:hypothetical protein
MSEGDNELLRKIEELRQGLDALGRSVTSCAGTRWTGLSKSR